jgi:hypothetical protein
MREIGSAVMRGLPVVAAIATAFFGLAACGAESEKFSDGKIADAIEAKDDEIRGDPFCVVDDYLNDPDEIEKADKKKGAPIITSARGGVGVLVEPPFPGDCEQRVRRGLNRLDPKDEE